MNKRLIIILLTGSIILLSGATYIGYRYLYKPTDKGPEIALSEMNNLLEPANLNLQEMDLSLSGLNEITAPELADLPELSLNLGTSTDLDIATSLSSSLDLTVAAPEIAVDLKAEDINISADSLVKSTQKSPAPDKLEPTVPNQQSPKTIDTPPDNTVDCSQFAAVPSCGYVPENVRALCEQCK